MPSFFKALLALATTAMPFVEAQAQAQLTPAQQQQAQSEFNEHKAMQMALRIHHKCGGLDDLTISAATITSDLRRQSLINMGALTAANVDANNTALQGTIDAESCDGLKAVPSVSVANERATFYKDYYLYVWHEYKEVASLELIYSGDMFDDAKYGCGGYSYDQIKSIKPLSTAAWQVMKTKGQFSNARAEAENILKACKANGPGMQGTPAITMLEAALAELAKSG